MEKKPIINLKQHIRNPIKRKKKNKVKCSKPTESQKKKKKKRNQNPIYAITT